MAKSEQELADALAQKLKEKGLDLPKERQDRILPTFSWLQQGAQKLKDMEESAGK